MASLLGLITPPGAAPGTGLVQIVSQLSDQLQGVTEGPLIDGVLSELPAVFGDYPSHKDVAPSAVFVAVFSVLALAHFYVFGRNWTRQQYFWPSFGLGFYCVFRVIGYGLRISWANDVLKVNTGIASTVFSLVSVLYINMMNMLLGHRIFTWRHPETGASSWFNWCMALVYCLVVGVIVMAILGQALPYLYFMSQEHFDMCKQVTRAASILNLFYALAGILLIIAAFVIPPGMIDHRFMRFSKKPKENLPPTHQATWIESCDLFYFPQKGSQRKVYKDQPLAKAIRVMPSVNSPASGLSEPQHDPHHNGPRIRIAVFLIVITSLILTMNCSFRAASTFINRTRGDYDGRPFAHFIFRDYIFYIFYGAFEAMVSVLFLVFRVDLRFYIPDMPSKRKGGDAVAELSTGFDYNQSRSMDETTMSEKHTDEEASPIEGTSSQQYA